MRVGRIYLVKDNLSRYFLKVFLQCREMIIRQKQPKMDEHNDPLKSVFNNLDYEKP